MWQGESSGRTVVSCCQVEWTELWNQGVCAQVKGRLAAEKRVQLVGGAARILSTDAARGTYAAVELVVTDTLMVMSHGRSKIVLGV